MAWNFHRRIKIIPGVYLNFNKVGITTSLGVKSANMTFGKSENYLNSNALSLGTNDIQKLSSSDSNQTPKENNNQQILEKTNNIFSADIQEITSQNLQGVKEVLILAHQQRKELNTDLLKIQASLKTSKLKLNLSYILLYGLIKKRIPEKIKVDIEAQKEAIKQAKEHIGNCYVKLDIDFEPEIQEKYNKLVDTFKNLTTSQKIWDVTSAQFQDRVKTRSSASTIVEKRNVKFSLKSLPDIKTNFEALYFQNANGADLYFYPCFIVMYSSKINFAIIGYDEITFNQSYVRFTETGSIPSDSKIIDKTWAKVNKNGTPDKRFKDNYQIPIVKYGEISLQTSTGLNEEYEFSNYEFTEAFGQAFSDYQQIIKSLNHI